jgi:CMP-N,N'-diacetyllegionaminic acid synthase
MKRKEVVALIPARSRSTRIKNKNIIKLNNKPLIFYTIKTALNSDLFDDVIVSTDSKKYLRMCKKFGASVPFLRPKKFSTKTSADYFWVKHTLDFLKKNKKFYKYFFILRPTNPFRTKNSIIEAWNVFKKSKFADTLRTVELCKQHPGKMWIKKKNRIFPLQKKFINKQPSYNNQYQALPKIFVQNGFLEISKVDNVYKYKTISGKKIIPFVVNSKESLDINYPEDVEIAKKYFKKTK